MKTSLATAQMLTNVGMEMEDVNIHASIPQALIAANVRKVTGCQISTTAMIEMNA